MSKSTNKRILQLYTEIGPSPVWLTQIVGREGLSQLFHYRLSVMTQEPLQVETLMGKPISFGIIATEEQPGRDFNGLMISLTTHCNSDKLGWYGYEIEVVPWLWLMTQRTHCRIFPGNGQRQLVTVNRVLQELFADYTAFQVDLSGIKGSYPQRDLWIQYNETDFNFFSRLTEEYGIYYYFQQEQDKHRLILGDQKQAYGKDSHESYLAKIDNSNQPQVYSWKHCYHFIAKSWSVNAHNFQQPGSKLKAKSDSCINFTRPGSCENYSYTNNFLERDSGQQIARLYSEREEAKHSMVEAESNLVALSAGSKLQIKQGDFQQETDKDFIVTSLQFTANDASFSSHDNQGASYANQFSCIPAKQIFRPSCVAVKPQAYQLHEAVVTGPQDAEIYTDELGRLRIQFRWDIEGKPDANASCWVRSSSDWEGVLRVGTPVLVAFLHGDIDQPVVMGPLYDTQQKPLFPEPTMSGLKRRHGSNGEDSYYNELRFDDKKDQAQVLLHACKDMQLLVDNDLTTEIKQKELHTVDAERQTMVKKGNDTLVLDQGNLIISVKEGKYELQVKGNIVISSEGDMNLHAGQSLKLSAGQQLEIQAGTSLTQKAGSVAINADTSLELKAVSTKIDGSATVAVKGGLINLN